MTPFIEQLPRHYRISPQDAELQRVLTALAERTRADLDFTLAQLIPSTASGWGLALWEAAYGIKPDSGLSEAERRARVLAKIQGTGMTTVQKIQAIAEQFSESPVTVRRTMPAIPSPSGTRIPWGPWRTWRGSLRS